MLKCLVGPSSPLQHIRRDLEPFCIAASFQNSHQRPEHRPTKLPFSYHLNSHPKNYGLQQGTRTSSVASAVPPSVSFSLPPTLLPGAFPSPPFLPARASPYIIPLDSSSPHIFPRAIMMIYMAAVNLINREKEGRHICLLFKTLYPLSLLLPMSLLLSG